MSMNELVKSVEGWSKDKGLDKADPRAQFLKVAEEVGEVAAAMARNDRHELIDGIGDVVVTLIILAQQHNLDLEHCLDCAWGEISNRTGKMKDGVFIKD
jgi:NTP pyrophosphatase (non-canonical NTP hydrolase)